ncbi:putative deacetylase LmbE-like domain-containing protein [Sparassis latifolia]
MPSAPGILLKLFILPIILSILVFPFQPNVHILFPRESKPPRFLLLTAHPDDECMFFAPTLLGLLAVHSDPEVYSLCLSVGNADGLGAIRRNELQRSLDILGVPGGRRWALDRPDLQDNITIQWDYGALAQAILPYILEHNITTILTFDYHGVSSHPNHISLPYGATQLITSLYSSPDTYGGAPRLFSLVTTSLFNKYTGPLAPTLVRLRILSALVLDHLVPDNGLGTYGNSSVFISGISGYKAALHAMMQHRSQLVWFRWLYVAFSRYMWTNEWIEITPCCVEPVPAAGDK